MPQEHSINWIRTDEKSNLLNSLEHCLLSFTLARSDTRNWKWCVAAAYSAAQIAMVIVLLAQGEMKHLHRNDREKYLEWLNKSGTPQEVPYPDVALNSFEYLVKCALALIPADIETQKLECKNLERNLNGLRILRDHWIHFGDCSSSVTVQQARIAVRSGIEVITKLPLASAECLYDSRTDQRRYELAISTLLSLLTAAELDDADPDLRRREESFADAAARLAEFEFEGDEG